MVTFAFDRELHRAHGGHLFQPVVEDDRGGDHNRQVDGADADQANPKCDYGQEHPDGSPDQTTNQQDDASLGVAGNEPANAE